MYIVVAIIAFVVLIISHEFGHFIAAKLCGVKVLEFSVGMGPKLLKKQGKETLYTLRLLPIGGFCAMEGEDEDTGDPRAFTQQPAWKRIIILCAGAAMNFLIGLILICLLFSSVPRYGTNTVDSFMDGCPYVGENMLQPGDTIYSVNGERCYISTDVTTFISRAGGRDIEVVVKRGGEKVTLHFDELIPTLELTDENGNTSLKYGFNFRVQERSFGSQLKYSWYQALDFVRMVRLSLVDLFSGAVGVKDLSGVVGIVSIINDVGQSSPSVTAALENIAYLVAFIAINLAVMNLLPIPALDGARILFLILTWCIERIIRRKLDPKYEGYIHAAGLVLLIGLMLFVMYNDIARIITG
ncbi:MAG: site-2 protease family protein [Oscillospiraceae bacterium]|nr:site-2 protease family protein [Oscillospiraceae bacterium]